MKWCPGKSGEQIVLGFFSRSSQGSFLPRDRPAGWLLGSHAEAYPSPKGLWRHFCAVSAPHPISTELHYCGSLQKPARGTRAAAGPQMPLRLKRMWRAQDNLHSKGWRNSLLFKKKYPSLSSHYFHSLQLCLPLPWEYPGCFDLNKWQAQHLLGPWAFEEGSCPISQTPLTQVLFRL